MEKGNRITIRISDEEMETFKSKAAEHGTSISDMVRAAAMKGIGRMTYEPELYQYLREI